MSDQAKKSPLSILIAEDDLICRKVAEKIMSKFGVVTLVEDGEQAIVKFEEAHNQEAPFDFALLDIMMPEVSGIEALAEFRAIEEERGISYEDGIKVVMCTALNDSQSIYQAHAAGCKDYLNKPIRVAAVTKVMNKLGLISRSSD